MSASMRIPDQKFNESVLFAAEEVVYEKNAGHHKQTKDHVKSILTDLHHLHSTEAAYTPVMYR